MVKIDGKPRLCKLGMWPDFDGYGFNLHAEKSRPGQYVGKVDEGSPSEAAGLREGDRIIEVNGFNISSENHKQVVLRIKSIPNETQLLVVDAETDRIYRESGLVISAEDAIVITSSREEVDVTEDEEEEEDHKSLVSHDSSIDKIKRIRFPLCLTGHPGFDISYYRHNDLFAVSKIHSSIAKKSGLRIGDRIHRINNVNVADQGLQRRDLLCLISSIPNEVNLRVSRAPKHQNLDNFTLPVMSSSSSSDDSVTKILTHAQRVKHKAPSTPKMRPRLCKVVRGSRDDKFGFTLLTDKRSDTQHIGNVYPGTPAFRSGVRPHDRIVEVNGVNVENQEHKEIVSKVNKSKKRVDLLLVDNKTYEHYQRQEIKIHGAMNNVLICRERNLVEEESSLYIPTHGKIRSCHIIKNEASESFGFSIQTIKKENTKFIKEISPDGPADRSGLLLDDVVLAVNGENVIEETHKAVVDRIISRDLDTTLLVTDKETFTYCMEHQLPLIPNPDGSDSCKGVPSMEASSSSRTSTTIEATIEHSPRIVVEDYEENEGRIVNGMSRSVSSVYVQDDVTITHANPCNSHEVETSLTSKEIHVDEEIVSTHGEVQEDDHRQAPLMGSTGNSPSPRSTPSPQFSNSGSHYPQNGEESGEDLNLNMTAAQMRERISAKKKRDPRKDDRMDILRKYQIIQTL